MRKKWRKTLVMGLLVMSVFVFSACADQNTETSQESDAIPEASAASLDSGQAVDEKTSDSVPQAGDSAETEKSGIDPDSGTSAQALNAAESGGPQDWTLGGIFEVYNVEEYEAIVESIRAAFDADDPAVMRIEENFARLKADNGKGEFVIYKMGFKNTPDLEREGFDPQFVMEPERMRWEEPLTAELYREVMEFYVKMVDEAVGKGEITQEQKETVIRKMNENLEMLK